MAFPPETFTVTARFVPLSVEVSVTWLSWTVVPTGSVRVPGVSKGGWLMV